MGWKNNGDRPDGWKPVDELTIERTGPNFVSFVGRPSPKYRPNLIIQIFGQSGTEQTWRVQYLAEWAPCCKINVVIIMTTTELQHAFSEVEGNFKKDWVFERTDDTMSFPSHHHGVNILLNAEICDAVAELLARYAKPSTSSQGG